VSANVSGGTFSSTILVTLIGYTSTRSLGNTDTAPILQVQASLSTCTFFPTSGDNTTAYNIVFDGNAQTNARLAATFTIVFIRCGLKNFRSASTHTGICIGCYATGNSVTIFSGPCYGCEAYANTATPFFSTTGLVCTRCISYDNTGASTDGFGGVACVECVGYNNGRHGFFLDQFDAVNCHAENNATRGFFVDTAKNTTLVNCSGYNNTSGFTNATREIGTITPSGSVFVDAANDNFALNNTAGAGALLRATGFPTTFPAGFTLSYSDVGAAQHQDAGGGLLVHPGMAGGMRG
jgi:hypothetical protein